MIDAWFGVWPLDAWLPMTPVGYKIQSWPCWFDVNYVFFQGPISQFSRTPFSAKTSLESFPFLVLPHEQFYPEGLSIFAPFRHLGIWVAYTYSTEIQRLSSTSLYFQALFRLKFKDFQGVCDPCATKGKQNWSLWMNFFHLHVLINSVQRIYQ